jgi:hypothetical protein
VGESPEQVIAGQRLGFTGTAVAHPDLFSDSIGVDQSEGAAQLDQQRVHVEVRYADLQRRSRR